MRDLLRRHVLRARREIGSNCLFGCVSLFGACTVIIYCCFNQLVVHSCVVYAWFSYSHVVSNHITSVVIIQLRNFEITSCVAVDQKYKKATKIEIPCNADRVFGKHYKQGWK